MRDVWLSTVATVVLFYYGRVILVNTGDNTDSMQLFINGSRDCDSHKELRMAPHRHTQTQPCWMLPCSMDTIMVEGSATRSETPIPDGRCTLCKSKIPPQQAKLASQRKGTFIHEYVHSLVSVKLNFFYQLITCRHTQD